jgi:hypothetical protein
LQAAVHTAKWPSTLPRYGRQTAVRLFVSPHTVNSHLRHAFTKLGVNSRVELARVVDAHAGGPALDN